MSPEESGSKQCPTCGSWDVRWAMIEDGGLGNWCDNCKASLKAMAARRFQLTAKPPKEGEKLQCPECEGWDVRWAMIEDGGQGNWCDNCKKSFKLMELEVPGSHQLYETIKNEYVKPFRNIFLLAIAVWALIIVLGALVGSEGSKSYAYYKMASFPLYIFGIGLIIAFLAHTFSFAELLGKGRRTWVYLCIFIPLFFVYAYVHLTNEAQRRALSGGVLVLPEKK